VSYDVGFEKPHPEMFRAALYRAGTTAEETLHVGDSWTADVEAARALGLQSLWLAPDEERRRVRDSGPGFERFPADPERYWAPWVG
jgi:FMN phosphatase YigB (HAD superfamily)